MERTFQRLCRKEKAYGKKAVSGGSGGIHLWGLQKDLCGTLTGVKDLFVTEGYAGGLTPLLGPDGESMVTSTDIQPEF